LLARRFGWRGAGDLTVTAIFGEDRLNASMESRLRERMACHGSEEEEQGDDEKQLQGQEREACLDDKSQDQEHGAGRIDDAAACMRV